MVASICSTVAIEHFGAIVPYILQLMKTRHQGILWGCATMDHLCSAFSEYRTFLSKKFVLHFLHLPPFNFCVLQCSTFHNWSMVAHCSCVCADQDALTPFFMSEVPKKAMFLKVRALPRRFVFMTACGPAVNVKKTHLTHTATHCNTLRCTATQCDTLQHTGILCNSLAHCNTLRHTATHYDTLQHTATHCNTLQHTATHRSTLQHTATHCNTLQHTFMHGPPLVHSATAKCAQAAVCCSVLQCVLVGCSALQHLAVCVKKTQLWTSCALHLPHTEHVLITTTQWVVWWIWWAIPLTDCVCCRTFLKYFHTILRRFMDL